MMNSLSLVAPALVRSDVTTTDPEHSLDLAALAQFDDQFESLIARLAQFADAQLLQLAMHAQRLETYAFRLRGACVAELRRRNLSRLAGGRGNRDTTGAGVKARITHLAEQIGVRLSTLMTDARIHEIFFSEETGLARETTLAREYYVIALGAPDPLAAIQTAHERCSDPGYKREQFRRDIRALKQATPAGAPTSTGSLRVKILPHAQQALTELTRQTGQPPETVVAEALLAYYHSLTSPPDGASHSTRRCAAPKPARHEQPSLPMLNTVVTQPSKTST